MKQAYNKPQGEDWVRQRGSTTLEICGWCKHAEGSGLDQGTCMLDGKRGVWSTPCRLKGASQSEFEAMIQSQRRRLERAHATIDRCYERIQILLALQDRAPSRPPLPHDRPLDHFNVGDDVAVWLDGRWVAGKVVPGYRHHSGSVSYILDGMGPTVPPFWGCGTRWSGVMLRTEFQWFRNHPEEYDRWFERTKRDRLGGSDDGDHPLSAGGLT